MRALALHSQGQGHFASCCWSCMLCVQCTVPLLDGIRHACPCMQVPVPLQGHPQGRLLCPAADDRSAQAAARVLGLSVPGAHPGRVSLRPAQPLHRRLPGRSSAARSTRGCAVRHLHGVFHHHDAPSFQLCPSRKPHCTCAACQHLRELSWKASVATAALCATALGIGSTTFL